VKKKHSKTLVAIFAHPVSANTDKGAVASVRNWLKQHGVKP